MPIFRKLFPLCLLLLWIGCETAEPPEDQTPARVVDFKFKKHPGGARILTGTLQNPGERHLRNAIIQVSLFNHQNERIESMNITILHVAAGESKSFREPIQIKADIARVKIRRILAQYAPS